MTSTTGTGASGEIRETRPQTNSSSIRSPITRMRLLWKFCRISSTRIELHFLPNCWVGTQMIITLTSFTRVKPDRLSPISLLPYRRERSKVKGIGVPWPVEDVIAEDKC
jgi:hypothetical protein